MNSVPTIALSIGDPAGIGPEIVLKALDDTALPRAANIIVVGDKAALPPAETATGLRFDHLAGVKLDAPGALDGPFEIGKISERCGRAALAYARRATELCLSGEADAMVTAPLNKEAVTRTGQRFTGHTEFISELCRVKLQTIRGAFDLIVAMYHDQGHIPMKLLDFENTVNVSLGLPIIRTSVDHGTAFDIAGQNRANPENMKAALRLAITLARNRRAKS